MDDRHEVNLYRDEKELVMVQFSGNSWNRFNLNEFHIAPQLAGARHIFQFQECTVDISLPYGKPDDEGNLRTEKIECHSWKNVGNKLKPAKYTVHCAEIRIDLAKPIILNKRAFDRPANRYDLIPPQKQKRLDELASKYNSIAEQAFQYWLRVVRWKTGYEEICRAEFDIGELHWNVRLENTATGSRFWSPPVVIVIERERSISQYKWKKIQEALNENLEPPIWFDFFFEGCHRLHLHDLHGSIISFAVSLESIVINLNRKRGFPFVGICDSR